MSEQLESPTTIRDRAVALADYLLAVRAQMERPARVIPVDAYRLDELPRHPDCQTGPGSDGIAWLQVGLPEPPEPVRVPPALRRQLRGEISATTAPEPDDPAAETGEDDFARWRDQTWRPWSLATAETEKTRTLHRQLFDLMHQMDGTAATTELVWGHGLLHTVVNGERVRYPLVATPVLIEYEPDKSLITVCPAGPSRLQTDPLAGLDERYLAQFLALGGPAGAVELDLWNDPERRELFERALVRLGHDRLVTDGSPAGDAAGADQPHVEDVSVLFVRPKQRLLRGFLENLRNRLLAGDTASVGALAAILAHEPSKLRMPGDRPQDWQRIGQRLLMPLPTNEAQESIARRLAQHRNVAVQGPPGTGKTHTIRNLICHLIAAGKRVLVLAQKEDPLRVLRDGLPEEVQPLCLAVLGRTTDQLVQLQLAARELSDRAATLDVDAQRRRVERLTHLLEQAEGELAAALDGLRVIARSEAVTYPMGGIALTPSELGVWLRERAADQGGIPDPVAGPAPLDADEFTSVLELAVRLAPADRVAALRPLPETADLPDATTASGLRTARDKLADSVERSAVAGLDLDAVREAGPDGVAQLRAELHDALSWLRRRQGSWTDRLGRLLNDQHWRTVWADHVAATRALLAELAELTRLLAGHRVTVPPAYASERKRLLAQLGEVRQRYAAGRGLSRLLQSALFRLAEEIRLDDEGLRTVEDVDVAVAWVRHEQLRDRLGEHWTQWIARLQIPAPDGDPQIWAGALLAEAEQSLDFDVQHWPGLAQRLRDCVPQLGVELDPAVLEQAAPLLAEAPAVFELDDLVVAQQSIADRLAPWPALAAAWVDLHGWDEAVAEVRRLVALRPEVERYVALRDRLSAVAPEWVAQIEAGVVPAVSGKACLDAWQWRQAQTWFDEVIGSVDPAVLARRVEAARERIRRLTSELVVASAWLEVSRGLDDRRRAALADWTTALRKIGKGTGRTAAAWQVHAQRAMASAVDAVPVWVMSVDRAIEQFAGGARFDVVIVDEASQADLFALPVLSLADRAVVVGDDQQIGPQLGFVGPVSGLIHSHLGDVPSAEHFDPESSLYDHAVRRSPERILLTEHFRCVPPIIEFSSRHYYDGKIMPLRADRPALAPVRAVYLDDGVRQSLAGFGDVNLAEATALVAQVAAMVRDPAYDGRTLGVISLLSTSGQAAYLLHLLREQIGEDEIQARRLRVGDAYAFQGDERDVVLLSMVVSDNDPRVAAFTRREYHRRVNVAASRARDQLWIFHSVRAGSLPPDDARGLLLAYAVNLAASAEPGPAELSLRCTSDFERDVLRRLVDRGFRPTPQFQIGAYRIDFVLNAPDGRRLAIECDGDSFHSADQWDSDMRRQAVLERVGNCVFVRIRGSIFAREPEVAMRPVWQRIAELEILP